MKNYEFDGKNYVYTVSATNVIYKFDQEKNEWLVKEKSSDPDAAGGIYGFENDTHKYTDPGDGPVYFWDKEKNAWFPKIDDDFMARHQMNYGFTDSNTEVKTSAASPNPKADAKAEKERKKLEASKKAAEPSAWFEIDEAHNTAIYISGLPLDVTMDELVELVGKCGLVARDDKNKDKIKLYKDSDGNPKGDALCTYIKMDNPAVLRWLNDIGLPQHKKAFENAKVDGRVLHRLTTEDRNGSNIALWTNHRVMKWLRAVDLAEDAPNMRGSEVHGGLMVHEGRFTSELLATLLSIPPSKTLLRIHLTTHFNQVIGRDVVQQKREIENTLRFVPLTLTARLKVAKKSQFTLKRKKSKSGIDYGNLVCPLEASPSGTPLTPTSTSGSHNHNRP